MAKLAPSCTILSIIFMLSSYSACGSRSYGAGGVVEHVPLKKWCIAKGGTSDDVLQSNIDFACAKADCAAIQKDASCYFPNTNFYHASYAMSSYYHTFGPDPSFCDFNNSGLIISKDPSYRACDYPSSS